MDGTEVRATLARNIKVFRARRNWSQADLAEKAGLSIVYLSDIERGNKWPYLNTLLKLAEAFKVEVYELLMPENTSHPIDASILDKYTKEVAAIFEKSMEMAIKRAVQSLSTMQDQYLSK
ncbi:MAG: helix-turn-helix domain-containing protein [Treponema sp.]|nr:helix-turn-helix domain-containing protein [Treponema sp.]